MSPEQDRRWALSRLLSIKAQLIYLCLLGVGFGAFRFGELEGGSRARAELAGPAVEKPTERSRRVQVTVATVTERARPRTLEELGRIEPRRRYVISAEQPGRVIKVVHEIGARLAGAGVVVELDPFRRRLALSSAQAERRLLTSQIALQERQLGRLRRLRETSAVSVAKLDAAEGELDVNRVRLELADLGIARAGEDLKSMTIAGPVGAEVVEQLVEVGELVTAGQPVARLALLDRVKVLVRVSSRSLSFIDELTSLLAAKAEGVSVSFSIAAVASSARSARLLRVAPVAEAANQRYLVELEADNADRALRAGLSAEVKFRLPSNERERVLSRVAIVDRQGLSSVFVLDAEGRVRLQRVEVLRDPGDELVVISGLELGARVVRDGSELVTDGLVVEVVGEDGAR